MATANRRKVTLGSMSPSNLLTIDQQAACGCVGKQAFGSHREAAKALTRWRKRGTAKGRQGAYRCQFCWWIHIGPR